MEKVASATTDNEITNDNCFTRYYSEPLKALEGVTAPQITSIHADHLERAMGWDEKVEMPVNSC